MTQRQPRVKNPAHLDYVRSLFCVVCADNVTVEAAHIRFACEEVGKRHTGMQEKPDDKWAVPLCGIHHREQHTMNERGFWEGYGTDPIQIARELYASSGDMEAGERTIIRNRMNAAT